ncbi:MAG: YqzL family protein [Candidatus Coproplasma sp.]
MKTRDYDTAELAWKMFEKTGSVSYYMLYKELKGK